MDPKRDQPERTSSTEPLPGPSEGPSAAPSRWRRPLRARELLIPGVAVALLLAGLGLRSLGGREEYVLSPSAPVPAATPDVAPAPAVAPAAARPPPRERLYGGRTGDWWRERLASLASRQDAEGRSLHALTLRRAVRLGIVPDPASGSAAVAGEGR